MPGTDISNTGNDANGETVTFSMQAIMDLFEANMSVDLSNFTITGTLSQFNTALSGADFASLAGSETLTNKTIDGDNNTISNLDLGNEVDWAAIGDVTDRTAFASGDKVLIYEAGVGMRKVDYDDLPGAGGGLSNVVEDTTPQLGGQLDVNGQAIGDGTRELLTFTEDASAVNHVNIENEATGSGPIISAAGDDTNVDLNISAKGTGNISVGNYTFDADQTVGAGQDNYVLTYDNGTGLVSLEAAAAGGNVTKVGTPVDNQIGVWTGDGTIEGDADFLWHGTYLEIVGGILLNERADHAATPTAGKAELWVENTATQTLQVTFDDGTDAEVLTGNSGSTLTDTAIALADHIPYFDASDSDNPKMYDLQSILETGLGQEHIWVPANAMTPQTTNGAAAGSVETTTNDVMLETLDFDATTDEFAQFSLQMPKSWDEGTLVVQFSWSHPSTATNFGVVWGCQAVAFANDDALDTAWGTAVTVTDTGGTTDDLYITSETSAMTVAGTPGAEEVVYFRVYRDADNGSDNLAVDARLHGVKIHWTRNALNED